MYNVVYNVARVYNTFVFCRLLKHVFRQLRHDKIWNLNFIKSGRFQTKFSFNYRQLLAILECRPATLSQSSLLRSSWLILEGLDLFFMPPAVIRASSGLWSYEIALGVIIFVISAYLYGLTKLLKDHIY